MGDGRFDHTATVLPNGKVLVAGGCCFANDAELYDPAAGTWAFTGAGGPNAFANFTATLLLNGKVLVVGGETVVGEGLATAAVELYDPVANTWSSASSLPTSLLGHTATLLADGQVLVAGGTPAGVLNFSTAAAELYDPVSNTWSATGSLVTAVTGATATLLPNAKVLVVAESVAQLYDPVAGTWSLTGSPDTLAVASTATLLLNGKVLIAGGVGAGNPEPYLSTAELYDPVTGTWSNTGSLNSARANHTATLLPNGTVLVAGGNDSHAALGSAEIYDPVAGTWSFTKSLVTPRYDQTASLLPDGSVLAAGGVSETSAGNGTASAELY